MWAVQVGQRWDEFSTEEQAQLASISFSLLQQGQSLKIAALTKCRRLGAHCVMTCMLSGACNSKQLHSSCIV